MSSEETVVRSVITITPRDKISAFNLWASLPSYRLSSILTCKPVHIDTGNLKSARIKHSKWTFMMASEGFDEIIVFAHQSEVQGGFELLGPEPASLLNLAKRYILFSPTLLTIALVMICLLIGPHISAHFETDGYLNQFLLYHKYPKEFLSIVLARINWWCYIVPSILAPILIAIFSLSGLNKSKNSRIHAVIKVESGLVLLVGLIFINSLPLAKLIHKSDLFFEPLNSPKIEKIILEQKLKEN